MSFTKSTGGRVKTLASKQGTETEDNGQSKNKTVDFSDGRFSITITIFQLVSLILFCGGIVWFIAACWVFDTRASKFEGDLNVRFEGLRSDYKTADQTTKDSVTEETKKYTNDTVYDLKKKNFLK